MYLYVEVKKTYSKNMYENYFSLCTQKHINRICFLSNKMKRKNSSLI